MTARLAPAALQRAFAAITGRRACATCAGVGLLADGTQCRACALAVVTTDSGATSTSVDASGPAAAPPAAGHPSPTDCSACAGTGNLPSRTWDGNGPECAACGGDGVVEPVPYELQLISELRDELLSTEARAQYRQRGEIPIDYAQDANNARSQLGALDVLERHVRTLLSRVAELELQVQVADRERQLAESAAELMDARHRDELAALHEYVATLEADLEDAHCAPRARRVS